MKPFVTVGLDGTPESLSAALWAAQEAHARGVPLRLLHAWVLLAPEGGEHPVDNDQNYWAKRIVAEAGRVIAERFPDLPLREDLVAEEPVEALLEAAGESEPLVLGSRDMAPMASYFLGDIGLHVLARSEGPTVLVRAREDSTPFADDGEVTVGLSLHGPCDALIEYAFDAAARRGVTLRAVHGRNLPPSAYTRGGIDPYMAEELTKRAQRDLTEALRSWGEKFGDVPVTEIVRMESPARAVVRDAAETGLLVVGRRTPRHALSPRIGHVLSAAIHHAPCPVAVVPHG